MTLSAQADIAERLASLEEVPVESASQYETEEKNWKFYLYPRAVKSWNDYWGIGSQLYEDCSSSYLKVYRQELIDRLADEWTVRFSMEGDEIVSVNIPQIPDPQEAQLLDSHITEVKIVECSFEEARKRERNLHAEIVREYRVKCLNKMEPQWYKEVQEMIGQKSVQVLEMLRDNLVDTIGMYGFDMDVILRYVRIFSESDPVLKILNRKPQTIMEGVTEGRRSDETLYVAGLVEELRTIELALAVKQGKIDFLGRSLFVSS